MPLLEQITVPCDGATLLIEDILSGINVYLQAPDGTRQDVISLRVTNGKVTSVRNHLHNVPARKDAPKETDDQ